MCKGAAASHLQLLPLGDGDDDLVARQLLCSVSVGHLPAFQHPHLLALGQDAHFGGLHDHLLGHAHTGCMWSSQSPAGAKQNGMQQAAEVVGLVKGGTQLKWMYCLPSLSLIKMPLVSAGSIAPSRALAPHSVRGVQWGVGGGQVHTTNHALGCFCPT